jgi:hypothetical protein
VTDDLPAKVAQLLGEPHPPDLRLGPRRIRRTDAPIGLALTVFGVARDLVAEANHAEAVSDWEQRQARLGEMQDVLSSVNDACREAIRAEVESLRMQGRARWERTETLCYALAALTREVKAIVDSCRERLAAIRAATITTLPANDCAVQRPIMVTGPDDPILANSRAACEHIDAETRRVLELRERTAAMSVADVYTLVLQQN